MDHKEYREWLSLLLYEDLEKDQVRMMQEHLQGCEACRAELAELRQMHSFLGKKQLEVSDPLLLEARTQLRSALRKERGTVPFWQGLTGGVGTWLREMKVAPQYAAVLAAVLIFVIGIFAGSFLTGKGNVPVAQSKTGVDNGINKVKGDDLLKPADFAGSGSDIANVRFIDSDTTDGEVEISFDAVKQVKLKRSINDPVIQKVLTYAVLKEQNPGVRLKAVNAIGAQQEQKKPDPLLKTALISALKFDKNAGVRKEALDILQKYPIDEETKAAFLQVLLRDDNPGMRVAAMKYLEAQDSVDPEVLNVLRDKAQTDQNAFIRGRATLVTDEIKH